MCDDYILCIGTSTTVPPSEEGELQPPKAIAVEQKHYVHVVLKLVCCLHCRHSKVPLEEALKKSGEWPTWESEWGTQQQRTFKFSEAHVRGGTRVRSIEYGKSKTRDGTRVETDLADDMGIVRPFASQVFRIVELRSLVAEGGGSSGTSSSNGSAMEQTPRAVQFAVLQRFDTTVREDHPHLAQQLLEAQLDSIQQELDAVPLDHLHPLNACLVQRGAVSWLQFVRQLGRSKQHFFGLPA